MGIISPSAGFVKSWQGIVELALRVAAIVLALLVIISGGSSQSSAGELPPDSMRDQTSGAGGWLIFVGFVAIVLEIIVVVIRFLNISVINSNITTFLIVDIAVSAVLAVAYLAGAAAIASYVPAWELLSGNSGIFDTAISRIIAASEAAAFFGFITMFLMIGLAVWVFLAGLIFKWGPTRAKYGAGSGGGGGEAAAT